MYLVHIMSPHVYAKIKISKSFFYFEVNESSMTSDISRPRGMFNVTRKRELRCFSPVLIQAVHPSTSYTSTTALHVRSDGYYSTLLTQNCQLQDIIREVTAKVDHCIYFNGGQSHWYTVIWSLVN